MSEKPSEVTELIPQQIKSDTDLMGTNQQFSHNFFQSLIGDSQKGSSDKGSKLVRKSELSDEVYRSRSVISIKGEGQVEYRFSKAGANLEELKIQTGDPFSMSQSASVVQDDNSIANGLLSSRLGGDSFLGPNQHRNSTFGRPSAALANLVWQVPFEERASVMQAITEEETDVNDDDLDCGMGRKMSIRAFNVVQMNWLNENPYERVAKSKVPIGRLSQLARASVRKFSNLSSEPQAFE